MGTLFKIMIVEDGRRAQAERAADAVLDETERLEAVLSEWKPETPLSEVNAHAGDRPVKVPDELIDVIDQSLKVSEASRGAFDISWAALWELWRFDRPPRVPAAADVAARLPLVNFRQVHVDKVHGTVFARRRGMLIGLGGIAKGHAVDRGASILRARGFRNFIIYAGGQVYAGGARGRRPWRVGIQDPRKSERWFATLELRDASVSTSGDYEHFFEIDGIRYHHIIDVRTGFPARACRAVTVRAGSGVLADALSTAVFVLGPKDGLPLLRKFEADGLIVDAQNRVEASPAMKEIAQIGNPTQ